MSFKHKRFKPLGYQRASIVGELNPDRDILFLPQGVGVYLYTNAELSANVKSLQSSGTKIMMFEKTDTIPGSIFLNASQPLPPPPEPFLSPKSLSAALFINFCFISMFLLIVSLQVTAGLLQNLRTLLLVAGDVESNPGPIDSSEKAPFGDLVTIPEVDSMWHELGIALGLNSKSLSEIKGKHSSNLRRCKREMFRVAVREGVTWEKVVRGIYKIGLRDTAQTVITMLGISTMNGLSSLALSAESTEDTIEADSTSPTKPQAKHLSIEFQTFKSVQKPLLSEAASGEPIILANAAFSKGLIAIEDVHELRVIPSNEKRAARLVSLVEDTLCQHPYKFESFLGALRSVSSHAAFAEHVSRLHRFRRVAHKMRQSDDRSLDVNHLSAELNNAQLVSDEVRLRAAKASNFVGMCSVFHEDLQEKDLGEAYLDLLDGFPNTKSVCSTLRSLLEGKRAATTTTTTATTAAATTVVKAPASPTLAKSPFATASRRFPGAGKSLQGEEHPSSSTESAKAEAQLTQLTRKSHSREIVSPSHDTDTDSFMSASSRHSSELEKFEEASSKLTQTSLKLSSHIMGDEDTVPTTSRKFPESSDSGLPASVTSSLSSTASSTAVKKPVFKAKKGLDIVTPDSAVAHVRGSKTKEQREKFRQAVKKWDSTQVGHLLSKGEADVEQIIEEGQTALMLAAVEGNKDVIRALLKHNASVVTRDSDGCTALYLAATNGNYEAVKVLAQHHLADTNAMNKYGEPMILESAKKGFSVVTELLIQYRANINVTSKDGMSPLYAAVQKGHLDVVKVLLENNAHFTTPYPKTGLTPLQESLEGDEPDIVRLLMRAESKVKKKSHQLFTCKTREEVKHLIGKGAKVNTRDTADATPLLVHTRKNNTEIVKELIHHKANVDLQDAEGFSALIVATGNGNAELAQLLVKHGAILDLKESKTGCTALMFAIQKGSAHLVKEFTLAGANVNLRNKDGQSSLDLARAHSNKDILEVLNMQPSIASSSSGPDPFLDILSGYMAQRQQHPRRNGKNRSSANVSRAKAPSVPEEDSAQAAEIKKYHKRVADLETRIHDLTIMGTMEITDESDLTYMERSRLESDYKKLKESKKKAEQYAVEAKQTAQRLSAENFKLREDLSKERHFNELTRKNMMREVELTVERGAGHTKTEVIRSDVFRKEVSARAFEGRTFSSYEKVDVSTKTIKKLLMEQTVSIDLFHIVFAGLPSSGKTTLVETLFDIPKLRAKSSIVDFFEGVIHQNRLTGDSHWFESSKLQTNVHTILTAFAYFFAREHKLPNIEKSEKFEVLFDDPEIQSCFEETCSCLQELAANINDETKVEQYLTGCLSLLNVIDVGVNKAVFEFIMAIDGENKNLILVNVLDLSESTKESLTKPLDLADEKYRQKYRENQISMYKSQSAAHYFTTRLQTASLCASVSQDKKASNFLIVGTHKDQLSKSECQRRKVEVMTLFGESSQDLRNLHSTPQDMILVNAADKASCELVKENILRILDCNKKNFSVDIPVRYIFLRFVLHSTKRVYMSRQEVTTYAKKCGINDQREVDDFLTMFRSCGSIISSRKESHFLYSNIVLLPLAFLRNLDKLYCIQDDKSISAELKQPAKFGMLSEAILKALWQGSDEGSKLISDFYINALQNVLLLIELDGGKFFCPSLRVEHSSHPLSPSSLIISSSVTFVSFSGAQSAFVKILTRRDDKLFKLREDCPYYDCIEFTTSEKGRVMIRFFPHSIEIFVDPTSISKSHKEQLYSILKTESVSIMNKISEQSRPLKYHFSFICPNSTHQVEDKHLVPFEVIDTSVEKLRCSKEGCYRRLADAEGALWVKATFLGSSRAAVHPDDVINPRNLVSICDTLSDLTIDQVCNLAKVLLAEDAFKDAMSGVKYTQTNEVLFHVLYNWHCKYPTESKRKLALKLNECGFHQHAQFLDSKLSKQRKSETEPETSFSEKEILYTANSWTQFGDVKELAKLLNLSKKPNNTSETETDKCADLLRTWLEQSEERDKRDKLALLFEEDYPAMSSTVYEVSFPA